MLLRRRIQVSDFFYLFIFMLLKCNSSSQNPNTCQKRYFSHVCMWEALKLFIFTLKSLVFLGTRLKGYQDCWNLLVSVQAERELKQYNNFISF